MADQPHMGFCSYCGTSTDGNAAVCGPCRAAKEAARAEQTQTRNNTSISPFATLLANERVLAFCGLGVLALALLVIVPNLGSGGGDEPTVEELEPLVRAHLVERDDNCAISHFSDLSVGDFSTAVGGWPVYVSHQVTCRQGRSTITYNGLDGPSRNVAATFVRRGFGGGLETFTPPIFEKAMEQLNDQLNKAWSDVGD